MTRDRRSGSCWRSYRTLDGRWGGSGIAPRRLPNFPSHCRPSAALPSDYKLTRSTGKRVKRHVPLLRASNTLRLGRQTTPPYRYLLTFPKKTFFYILFLFFLIDDGIEFRKYMDITSSTRASLPPHGLHNQPSWLPPLHDIFFCQERREGGKPSCVRESSSGRLTSFNHEHLLPRLLLLL